MQSTPTSETFHSDVTLRGAGRPLGRIAVHITGKRYVRSDPRSFEHFKKHC